MFAQSIPLDSKESQASVHKQLAKSFIRTMQKCNSREKARPGLGVFYATEYKMLWDKLKPNPTREVIWGGGADSTFWEMTGPYQYQIREKKPSEAILAFLTGPTIAECASVITICFYAALLDVMGEKKFNEIFKYPSLTVKQNFLQVSYQPFVNAWVCSDLNLLNIGDVCYIQGVENYLIKHPAGVSQGWNVVKVAEDSKGEPLFEGFGFPTALTYSQIKSILLAAYNKPRDSFDIDLIKSMDNPAKYDTYKETAEEIVGLSESVVVGFNTSAILKHLNSNIKEIRQIFLKDLASLQPTEVTRALAEIKKDKDKDKRKKKIIGGILIAGSAIAATSLFCYRYKAPKVPLLTATPLP